MNMITRLLLLLLCSLAIASSFGLQLKTAQGSDSKKDRLNHRALRGLVEPSATVTLGMLAEGVLLSGAREEGDFVRADDIIASLESVAEKASLQMSEKRASSTLNRALAKKRLELASLEYKRLLDLYNEDAATRKELDEARLTKEAAAINHLVEIEALEIARLAVVRDRASFARRFLRSPIDGYIIKRYREPGEIVHALDPRMFQISCLDPIRVRLDCPAETARSLIVGAPARVIDSNHPDAPLPARIGQISPVIDAASNTVLIRLELANPKGRLKAGMGVHVEFGS